MPTIASIQARISGAIRTLVDADRNNPATLLTPEQLRQNPYAIPSGDNGAVDRKEAMGVADPFAKSVFEAASMAAGKKVLTGGSDGLVEVTAPEYEVALGKMRQFQSHVNAIVGKLETDSSGEVTQAALDGLSETIKAYFKATYRGTRAQPGADLIARYVAVVREAATGVVEWR